MARIASAAAAVRNVTSATGRPPATSASPSGVGVGGVVEHDHGDEAGLGEG